MSFGDGDLHKRVEELENLVRDIWLVVRGACIDCPYYDECNHAPHCVAYDRLEERVEESGVMK